MIAVDYSVRKSLADRDFDIRFLLLQRGEFIS
jgi:hypothetical protein